MHCFSFSVVYIPQHRREFLPTKTHMIHTLLFDLVCIVSSFKGGVYAYGILVRVGRFDAWLAQTTSLLEPVFLSHYIYLCI